jgi:hypothetical protein
LTTQQFTDLFREFTLYYKEAYINSDPKITLIINAGAFRQDNVNWSLTNCPNSWYKFTTLGKIYQANNELDDAPWLLPILNSKQSGSFIRGMTELSTDNLSKGGWSTHTPRNLFALFSYMIYWGMDISDQIPASVQNSLYAPAYDYFNKYAGKKDTANSFVAMCALHDGLDASDAGRFPKQTYGSVSKGNVQRYINIQNQFAVYGARLDDTAAATKKVNDNMDAAGINDVGWRIFPGNYDRYLHQINANSTSAGYWNVDAPNDVNSIYGRFARGFDLAKGKNALYFDADDSFLNKAPVNSQYPVMIEITYLDNDTGSWQLFYDQQNNTDQPSIAVTCANSGIWKKASITLNDAYFGNRGINGSDFYIKSTNSKNVIFSLVELSRPDTGVSNIGFNAPSRLTFDTLCVSSTSAAKAFSLSGAFLNNSKVIIGPLADFSFATDSDGDYRDSLIISNYGASFNQIIYVKFKPTQAASYDVDLPVRGGGVNAIHVNISAVSVSSNPQQAPVQPSGISGVTADSLGICGNGNFNFSIAPVIAATSYSWTPPPGCSFSLLSSDGTSILLSTSQGFSSGTLAVTANNGCGSSLPATKVLSAIPATPDGISGPSKIKAKQTGLVYRVTPVPGLNYIWTVPNGASIVSGQNTSTVTVNWGNNSGKIKVSASNSCGSSAQAGLQVNFVTIPTVYASSTALPSFGSICVNGSVVKSFSLYGTLLNGSDIVIGPLTGYTFSFASNGTYSSSLTITGYGTSLSQTIYVRFSPVLVSTYNGNVPVSGGGANAFSVALSGSGVSSSPSLFSLVNNITCTGLQNGAIDLVTNGGSGPFSYSWTKNGSLISSAEDISGLSPGNYKVINTSQGGCTTSTLVILSDPAPLFVNATPDIINCNGSMTTLAVNATGGALPYSFSLNNGSFQNNGIFDNLVAGDYTVAVKDANGCIQTTNTSINEPSAISVSASAGDIISNGGTTTLIISATGGVGNYQYKINDGIYQTGNTFTVGAGTYTITVKDANGCIQTTTTTINEHSAIGVNVSVNDITCNGSTTTLTVSASGGAGNYQYEINNGAYQTDNSFTVGAGTYTINVKDANGSIGTTTCNC